jgi:hypothetical protein
VLTVVQPATPVPISGSTPTIAMLVVPRIIIAFITHLWTVRIRHPAEQPGRVAAT